MKVKYFFTGALILVVSAGVYIAQTSPVNGQAASSTEDINISITVPGESVGGGGSGVKNPANITFKGFAYSEAIVTFLRSGVVVGTTVARENGTFNKTVTINPGFITFGIRARDDFGLNSATTNLTINVVANANIDISNIFLSPTITADRFKLQKGGSLRIFGTTFPEGLIRLFNNFSPSGNPVAEIRADSNGKWEYLFPTQDLGEGTFSLKVNAERGAPYMISPFSQNLEFTIAELVCSGADFNIDGDINLIDFSIMIFYWQRNPIIGDITNICVDLNNDELVDIFDFSILMHQWTD